MTIPARTALVIVGLLVVLAPRPSRGAEAGAADSPACAEVESIGVATMTDDGTIRMRLRSPPPGPIIEGELSYKPGDLDYRKIIDHLGGLAPGQIKPVKPWC
jgi:hypothetical protein